MLHAKKILIECGGVGEEWRFLMASGEDAKLKAFTITIHPPDAEWRKRLRFLAAKDDCPMGQEVIRAVDEKWEREHEELKEEF